MKRITTKTSNLKPYEVPECDLFPIVPHGVLCESFSPASNEDFDETSFDF